MCGNHNGLFYPIYYGLSYKGNSLLENIQEARYDSVKKYECNNILLQDPSIISFSGIRKVCWIFDKIHIIFKFQLQCQIRGPVKQNSWHEIFVFEQIQPFPFK